MKLINFAIVNYVHSKITKLQVIVEAANPITTASKLFFHYVYTGLRAVWEVHGIQSSVVIQS